MISKIGFSLEEKKKTARTRFAAKKSLQDKQFESLQLSTKLHILQFKKAQNLFVQIKLQLVRHNSLHKTLQQETEADATDN